MSAAAFDVVIVGGGSAGAVLARRLSEDPDGDDRFRGRSGPLPIRHRRADELTPALNAFVDASANPRPTSRP